MTQKIQSPHDLQVYQKAFATAMELFELSKGFPKEEMYSLTDQVRRSSRSVCANLAEAWRKRRYSAAFTCKLSDAESEAAETQVWIEFAVKCGYLNRDQAEGLYRACEEILRTLVGMITHPETWVIGGETHGKGEEPK
jgi:four helix bundle protein